jgi:hypothetical protein
MQFAWCRTLRQLLRIDWDGRSALTKSNQAAPTDEEAGASRFSPGFLDPVQPTQPGS